MTAATLTELSVTDFPGTVQSGTGVRRRMVFVRITDPSAETLDLSSYVPGAVDVEGIVYETDDGVVSGTAATWSTYTLTFGTGVNGAYEGCFVIRTTV